LLLLYARSHSVQAGVSESQISGLQTHNFGPVAPTKQPWQQLQH
jgi:hypothetical protein